MGFPTMGAKPETLRLRSDMLLLLTRRNTGLDVEDSERFVILVEPSLNVLVQSDLWSLSVIKIEIGYSCRSFESSTESVATTDCLSLLYCGNVSFKRRGVFQCVDALYFICSKIL